MQLAVLPQRGFPDIVDGVKQTPQADVPAGGAAGARGAGGGGRVPAASGVHGEGRGLRAAGGGPAAAPDWTFWRLAPAAVIAATAAASASQQPCNCRLAAGSSSQPLPYLTRALPSALPPFVRLLPPRPERRSSRLPGPEAPPLALYNAATVT